MSTLMSSVGLIPVSIVGSLVLVVLQTFLSERLPTLGGPLKDELPCYYKFYLKNVYSAY